MLMIGYIMDIYIYMYKRFLKKLLKVIVILEQVVSIVLISKFYILTFPSIRLKGTPLRFFDMTGLEIFF
jgi:hypothetical protein